MKRRSFAKRSCLGAFTAVALLNASPLSAQSQKPLELEDLEMGRRAAPVEKANADPALRAQFGLEYVPAAGNTRPVFEKYLPILGTAAILDYLEARFPKCHEQAHDLGRALFALREDIGGALRECGMRCTSACMHGVVGEAFGGSGLTKIASAMKDFCTTGAMAEIHKPGNCAHGIGHALMFSTGDEVNRALNACLYFDDPGMRYYCATGVFMELLLPERKGTPRAELHDPCDLYPDYAAACYRYRARTMLLDLGGDRERLVSACGSLERRQRLGCFQGLGNTLLKVSVKHPSLAKKFCTRGTADDQVMCIEGLIEKLADYDEAKAMKVCATLEGNLADVCVAAARGKMYQLGKKTMEFYHDPKLVKTRNTLDDAAEDGHAHHGH